MAIHGKNIMKSNKDALSFTSDILHETVKSFKTLLSNEAEPYCVDVCVSEMDTFHQHINLTKSLRRKSGGYICDHRPHPREQVIPDKSFPVII